MSYRHARKACIVALDPAKTYRQIINCIIIIVRSCVDTDRPYLESWNDYSFDIGRTYQPYVLLLLSY